MSILMSAKLNLKQLHDGNPLTISYNLQCI